MNQVATMPDPEKLSQLLARWDEQRQRGQELSVAELTAEAPELAGALQRQIQQLRAMDWLDEPSCPPVAGERVHPGAAVNVPPLLAGRYRMESLIAEGGFAQVWRGMDTALQRPVAVKITTRECLAEARRIAQLKHHGIVAVHDVGQEAGFCFIVFDLIDGTDLARRIRRDRPSWQESAAIVAEVATYLHHAHARGFIHRDIKPANILLTEQGTPVLADFGIAITAGELVHEVLTAAGTLAYMAPEQVSPESKLDARTDIHGLGVVLYELLTGQLPFQGETLWELRQQILTRPPGPLRVPGDDRPPELERICLKCLAKDPRERYASAQDLADALRAVLRLAEEKSSS
jgi:serine/threonine protein kinase